jgi:hypothetical protein
MESLSAIPWHCPALLSPLSRPSVHNLLKVKVIARSGEALGYQKLLVAFDSTRCDALYIHSNFLTVMPPAPRRVSLTMPNLLSTRQQDLHHHSRQVKEHSHSPNYNLWRHGCLATRTP